MKTNANKKLPIIPLITIVKKMLHAILQFVHVMFQHISIYRQVKKIRAKMNYCNLDDIHYLFYTNAKQCKKQIHKSPAKNIFTVNISIDTLIIMKMQFCVRN